MSSNQPISSLLSKLRTRSHFDEADIAAINAVSTTKRIYEASSHIVRERVPPPPFCSLLLSGFAIRQKYAADGQRQIVGISLPGDLLDLQHLFLNQADHSVLALTRVETLDIDRVALQHLALHFPNIGRALWTDALIEASIQREWILNIGRRDARQRVTHLLCEFALRIGAAGLDHANGYELPLTQEQLGDAVGLTSVHINRTLKLLVAEGVLRRDRRHVSFSDWAKVRAIGDFSARYLHLDQQPFEAIAA